jgi:quinol monooxygenase YgiN
MSTIILQGYILVSDDDLANVKAELLNHSLLTKQETGCLVFKVEQDALNDNKFSVYEEFIDQQSFDAHQIRVKASIWGTVSKNVERYYEISSRD